MYHARPVRELCFGLATHSVLQVQYSGARGYASAVGGGVRPKQQGIVERGHKLNMVSFGASAALVVSFAIRCDYDPDAFKVDLDKPRDMHGLPGLGERLHETITSLIEEEMCTKAERDALLRGRAALGGMKEAQAKHGKPPRKQAFNTRLREFCRFTWPSDELFAPLVGMHPRDVIKHIKEKVLSDYDASSVAVSVHEAAQGALHAASVAAAAAATA